MVVPVGWGNDSNQTWGAEMRSSFSVAMAHRRGQRGVCQLCFQASRFRRRGAETGANCIRSSWFLGQHSLHRQWAIRGGRPIVWRWPAMMLYSSLIQHKWCCLTQQERLRCFSLNVLMDIGIFDYADLIDPSVWIDIKTLNPWRKPRCESPKQPSILVKGVFHIVAAVGQVRLWSQVRCFMGLKG